jgi:hypothetical protein
LWPFSVSLLDGDSDAEATHLEHLNSWLALQKYCTLSVKKLRALGKVAASTPSVEAIQKREKEFLSTLEFVSVSSQTCSTVGLLARGQVISHRLVGGPCYS